MQAPQFVCSKPYGQTLQVNPDHWFWHEQLHPVAELPETVLAWLLQLAAVVQVRTHVGYPSYPAMHAPHCAVVVVDTY